MVMLRLTVLIARPLSVTAAVTVLVLHLGWDGRVVLIPVTSRVVELIPGATSTTVVTPTNNPLEVPVMPVNNQVHTTTPPTIATQHPMLTQADLRPITAVMVGSKAKS